VLHFETDALSDGVPRLTIQLTTRNTACQIKFEFEGTATILSDIHIRIVSKQPTTVKVISLGSSIKQNILG
jgi:hypothetical protein